MNDESSLIPTRRNAGGRAAGCGYSGGVIRTINGREVRYYAGGKPYMRGASDRDLEWIKKENNRIAGK